MVRRRVRRSCLGGRRWHRGAASLRGFEVALSELASVEQKLSAQRVFAAISGTVLAAPVAEGEVVGSMTVIAELADFASLAVEADVPEEHLRRVQINAPVDVGLVAFPGERYRGEVSEIAPVLDRATGMVKVTVTFSESNTSLRPEMSAHVTFREAPAPTVASPTTRKPARADQSRG